MEMKYEAVFGPQELFIDAKKDTVVIVKYDDVVVFFSCYSDFFDHLRAVGRGLSVDAPVIAMRRIIHEPKHWTMEDKKAGRLPDVGAEFKARGYVWECVRILNNTILAVVGDSYCGFDIDECKPIESPEEKAARLRSEWCNRAMDYSTIQQLYDSMLSGDLPVPVAPEQNK